MKFSFTTRLLLSIAVIGVIVYFIWRIFFHIAPITNFPPRGDKIVAFGDSLVEGVGSTDGNDLVSLIAVQIGKPILNAGKSGDTSEVALGRLDIDVLRHDPDVVIVLLGGNDYLRRVPKAETFENISTIVEKIQEKGAVVVLLGVRGGVLQDNFDTEYGRIAKKYNTFYVENVLQGLLGHPEYMFDGIHPNNAGYKKIAERVTEVMRKIFP